MSAQNRSYIEYKLVETALVITILEERLRDIESVNLIKEEMVSAVKKHSSSKVVIDLSRVSFISSVGFLAFLALRREQGIEHIILCGIDPNVREMFSLCRLIPSHTNVSAPFKVADSIEDAIAM